MKHEYEAKFLYVDVVGLQAKLTALGAVRTFPRALLTRKIFENDALEGGAWLRLRDEGTRCTLTLKQVTDSTTIDQGVLVGADDLEVLVDEDVVRPVDADVVDLILAVAQLHNTVDDAPRVGGQRSFRRLIGCRSADDRP